MDHTDLSGIRHIASICLYSCNTTGYRNLDFVHPNLWILWIYTGNRERGAGTDRSFQGKIHRIQKQDKEIYSIHVVIV